jgi:hypothetical protein
VEVARNPRGRVERPIRSLADGAERASRNGRRHEYGRFANEPLDNGLDPDGDDLAELPLGVRKLGGSWFTVGPMMIRLRARDQPGLPAKVAGIKVGSSCVRLRILHGAEYEVRDGTPIGAYTVRYADRTAKRVPIVFGQDVGSRRTPEEARRSPPARTSPGRGITAGPRSTGPRRSTSSRASGRTRTPRKPSRRSTSSRPRQNAARSS